MNNFQPSNFQQGNFQQNFSNNGGNPTDKKRDNFTISKVYGTDGVLTIGIWNATNGTKVVMNIKRKVGSDPTTGAMVLEQKKPGEIPSVYLNQDDIRAFLDCINDTTLTKLNGATFGRGKTSVSFEVNGEQVKLTIKSSSVTEPRTITLDPVSYGTGTAMASWENLVYHIKTGYKKAMTCKLDPEEFGMAMSSEDNNEV